MIRIETQPLSLKPVPTGFGPLSDGQKVYLQKMQEGLTIAKTVEFLLSQGRLVNFGDLFNLVKHLHDDKLIQNPAFAGYFSMLQEHEKPAPKGVAAFIPGLFKKDKAEEYITRHPFFRAQNPVVTALFAQHAEIIEAKVGTVLCQTGHLERDLFFMIEGEAAIYKPTDTQGRRLMGFLGKDAVIGEVGFFVGELRTADVIITKPAKLVAVRYEESAFGRIINKEIAKNLQSRFRVVHALAKSPFLKSIPEEAMDSLLYSGHIRTAKEFEVLCKEDDRGESCFVVVQGSVVITKGQKTVGVLGPGEAFGEIALFFTQGRRTATAMAQRETTLLEISAKDFYGLLSENILLACEFEKLALTRSQKLKQTG
jgi:CRP-like cAMP-binding protein